MLEFALTGLLLLQTASGSPERRAARRLGRAASRRARRRLPARRPADGAALPRPTPEPTPTPTPRPSNDLLVVVNKSDNSLSVLDGATGKLKWTAPVETGPHEAEVLADGKTVAVSDYGRTNAPGHMVSIIELATGKIVGRVDLGSGARPHGLAALKDGRLLVTAEGKKELVVVDPKGAKVLSRMPTGHALSHMVAASPDGKRAYVSSLKDGVVTVIDLPGGVVGDVPTGKGAEGIDVTPDGREVWVVNREADTISVIDTKTLKVAATIKAGAFPIRVKITPDGKRAVVAFAESGDVGVFDVATRTEVKRIPVGRDAVAASGARVFQGKFGASPTPVGVLHHARRQAGLRVGDPRGRRRGDRPREPAGPGRVGRGQGARRPGRTLYEVGGARNGLDPDLDRLDASRALELEPALVAGPASAGGRETERGPSLADAVLAIVGMRVREGLGVLVDENQVSHRAEPRLEIGHHGTDRRVHRVARRHGQRPARPAFPPSGHAKAAARPGQRAGGAGDGAVPSPPTRRVADRICEPASCGATSAKTR